MTELVKDADGHIEFAILSPLAKASDWYRANIENFHACGDIRAASGRYLCWLKQQGIVLKNTDHSTKHVIYFKDEQSMTVFLLRWS